MTEHSITTAHFPKLYYRRFGSGPALALIHGFPATGALWNDVIDTLARDFTVLVPDLPGTGQSRLEGEQTSMDALAAAIYAMLLDAGFNEAVLGAHSMGGYVALSFAKKYPENTSGIALIHSTASADDEDKKESRRKTIVLIRRGGKEAFVRSFVPGLFSPDTLNKGNDMIQRQTAASLLMPENTMIAFYTAMMERDDSSEVIRDAAFPVQWLLGAQDSLLPVDKALQQIALPAVSFVSIFPHTGHMSMLEHPEALAHNLRDFARYATAAQLQPATLLR